MQSDHRVIQMTLAGDQHRKKSRWPPPRKGQIENLREFGEILERDGKLDKITSLGGLEALFAETAEGMARKPK